MTSTAEEIVTDAFGLLTAIDINEVTVSPPEMTKGLRALTRMLDSWAGEGLNVSTQILTGTTTIGSATITGFTSTAKLAPGLNINGTGIPLAARIKTIDSDTQITLDSNATASGTVTLTFAALPFEAKFEEAICAQLALRLAPLVGEEKIPDMTVVMAGAGWSSLCANFRRVPKAQFDPMLVNTFQQRMGLAGTNG